MAGGGKIAFEQAMLDLLGLPKGTIWFELRCHYKNPPMVKCQYEVRDEYGNLIILEDRIATLTKNYEIQLKERGEHGEEIEKI